MHTGVTKSTFAVSLCQNTQNAHMLGKRPRSITAAEGHFVPAAAVHPSLASTKTSQTAARHAGSRRLKDACNDAGWLRLIKSLNLYHCSLITQHDAALYEKFSGGKPEKKKKRIIYLSTSFQRMMSSFTTAEIHYSNNPNSGFQAVLSFLRRLKANPAVITCLWRKQQHYLPMKEMTTLLAYGHQNLPAQPHVQRQWRNKAQLLQIREIVVSIWRLQLLHSCWDVRKDHLLAV